MSLMDDVLDDGEGDEDRDDVERPGNGNASDDFPSIERTVSFDDWNDQDEHPAQTFRFDEWSCTSKEHSHEDTVDTYPLYNPTVIYDTKNGCEIIQNDYTHSSSTMALVAPSSNSYIFQPIRQGSKSLLSVDTSTSVAPTVSLHTDDPPSLFSEDQQQASGGVAIPECPGIPRVGNEDEEEFDGLTAIRTIQIDLGDGDEPSHCLSSPTNFVPPIPQEIFVRIRLGRKGWTKIVRHWTSWKSAVAIVRHKSTTGNTTNTKTTADKARCNRRRCIRKRTLGEF